MDSLQQILGELSDVVGAGKAYTDYDTILKVQKAIQKLGSLDLAYANCPTNKAGNTKIGPKFAKALTAFNKQFGNAADGGAITDGTLAALKSDKVQNAASGKGAPPVSPDAQALVDLAKAQDEEKKAAEAKAAAAEKQAQADALKQKAAAPKATSDDKAKAQAADQQAKQEQAAADVQVKAADVKLQAAADKVKATTDDPEVAKKADETKQASKALVDAKTPEQTRQALVKVEETEKKIEKEVQNNPAAKDVAATQRSFVDFLKQDAGPLPVWGWAAIGVGVAVAGYLYVNRKRVVSAVAG